MLKPNPIKHTDDIYPSVQSNSTYEFAGKCRTKRLTTSFSSMLGLRLVAGIVIDDVLDQSNDIVDYTFDLLDQSSNLSFVDEAL